MTAINFSEFSVDRIGEAFVRMNCWEWDDICGPKPEGFDLLTDKEKHRLPAFNDAMNQIRKHLTHEQMSMYWWTIKLGRTYDEWRAWYNETYLRRKNHG